MANLFNTVALSDVNIKQIDNDGNVVEYYGHKAILGARSSFFFKAFSGNFKEAKSDVIELHDDNAKAFELALRYIYLLDNSDDPMEPLFRAMGIKYTLRAQLLIGATLVADKYDIVGLASSAASDMKLIDWDDTEEDAAVLLNCIDNYYAVCIQPESEMGMALINLLLDQFRSLTKKGSFIELVKRHTTVGTDIVLSQRQWGLLAHSTSRCNVCGAIFTEAGDGKSVCRFCVRCGGDDLITLR